MSKETEKLSKNQRPVQSSASSSKKPKTKTSNKVVSQGAKQANESEYARSEEVVSINNDKKDNIPHNAVLKKNTLYIGIGVVTVFLMISIAIIGSVGFRYYSQYTAQQDIISQIKSINSDFSPIEDDYENLSNELNSYDTGSFSKEQSQLVSNKVEDINIRLNEFQKKLDEQHSSELEDYISSLKRFTQGISSVNNSIVPLVDYITCYSSFDTETASLGVEFQDVDQSQTEQVTNLYFELSGATEDFENCLIQLNTSEVGDLINITTKLNNETLTVANGIKNGTLTQNQLDEFVNTSVDLQQGALDYITLLTDQLEKAEESQKTSLDSVQLEQRKLEEKYNLAFEN